MKHRFVRACLAAAVAGTVLLGLGMAGSASSKPKPRPAGPHITATPASVVELSTDGAIGFAVHGSGFFSTESVSLDSPGLDAACPSSRTTGVVYAVFDGTGLQATQNRPVTFTTDFSGMFNATVAGFGCAPGTYQITAFENASPNRTVTTSVTIRPPAPTVVGVTVSPPSQVETGVAGSIATTVIVHGLNPREGFVVSSPALAAACRDVIAIDGATITASLLPISGTTDFAGNDVVSILARGCHAGTYPITVTETGAGHRSFTASFTILRP